MEWVARDRGVALHRSRVGEVNVVRKMVEVGATVGGEGNGGVIWPRTCFGRDAATGVAVLLHLMAATGRPLSALASMLPDYAVWKLRFAIPPARVAPALEALVKRFEGAPADREDGIRLRLDPDAAVPWIHARSSNTEPIVRAVVEARNAAEAEAISRDVRAALEPFA
jgi:phosphomannomutase